MKKCIITLLICFTTLICKSQCTIADPCFEENITATTAYLGQYGSVKVTVDDAYNDDEITHPLIVAEGFDVGVVIEPEKKDGSYSYKNFRDFLSFGGSNLRNLIWSSTNKDYDIIYVDWDNGVDYLQRNAYALEAVIEWVNTVKLGTEQNVVLGQSMGGVIARWALADMEERSIDHDTRLFISHDAPQQGANIPASLQFMYRHGGNQYVQTGQTLGGSLVTVPLLEITVGVSNYLSLLDTPATKQLLKNRSTSSYTIANTDHDSFYNDLKNKGVSGSGGYPVNSRNIALSNGSECGDTQDFLPGDHLVNYQWNKGLSFWGDLLSLIYNPLGGIIGGFFVDSDLYGVAILGLIPGHSKYNVDFQAKSIPYGTGNQIYKGVISYTKKILWFIPVTVNITNVQKNQPSGILPFDTYGGGFYNINGFIDTNNLPSGAFIRDRFGFIPTASALDIGKNNVSLIDSDYLKSYVGANPPSAPKNSPFDNYSTEFDKINPNAGNYQHISFNTRNGNWLATELDNIANNNEILNCTYICNGIKISGSNSVCIGDSKVYSVSNLPSNTIINWSISPSGGFTLTPNGSSVTVTPNGNFNGVATLSIDIDSDCGFADATKDIQTGAQRPIMYDSNGNEVASFTFPLNTWEVISFSTPPGTLEWEWRHISGNFSFMPNNNYAQVFASQNTFGIVDVRVRDNCGWGPRTLLSLNFSDGSGGGFGLRTMSTSSNPDLSVEIQEYYSGTGEENEIDKDKTKDIYSIHIFDVYGIEKFKKYDIKDKITKIKKEKLSQGIYYIRLTNSKGSSVTKGFAHNP